MVDQCSKGDQPVPSIHVGDLPFPGIQHYIEPRTDLDPCCGRDIIHFMDGEEEIGGVVYGGLSSRALAQLQENHVSFSRLAKNVRRGGMFQRVGYGKMTAVGFKSGQGGSVGSGYGDSYPLNKTPIEATLTKAAADVHVKHLLNVP